MFIAAFCACPCAHVVAPIATPSPTSFRPRRRHHVDAMAQTAPCRCAHCHAHACAALVDCASWIGICCDFHARACAASSGTCREAHACACAASSGTCRCAATIGRESSIRWAARKDQCFLQYGPAVGLSTCQPFATYRTGPDYPTAVTESMPDWMTWDAAVSCLSAMPWRGRAWGFSRISSNASVWVFGNDCCGNRPDFDIWAQAVEVMPGIDTKGHEHWTPCRP